MFPNNFSNRQPSVTSSSSVNFPVTFPATSSTGLYLPSPSLVRTPEFRLPEIDIQNFQLHELLKNPHVFQLWNQYQAATDKLLQESEEQKKLLQQINGLTAEVHLLRTEIAEARYQYNQPK